jgi:hypothetical protein
MKTKKQILGRFEDLYDAHYLFGMLKNGGIKKITKRATPSQYMNAIRRANRIGGDPYIHIGDDMYFIEYTKSKLPKDTIKRGSVIYAKKTATKKKTTTRKKTTRSSAASKLAKIRKILC